MTGPAGGPGHRAAGRPRRTVARSMAPPVTRARRRASDALLAVGYPLAWGAGAKLVPAFRQRRARRFAALEAGTGLVTLGLAVRRRTLAAAVNGAFFTAFAIAWAATGPRPRPPRRDLSGRGAPPAVDSPPPR